MPIFPNELIENILEHVYGSYPSPKLPLDLSRCALVCHTWYTIAQPLIFSQLRIDLQDKRITTLELNPHLRRYVRQAWVGYLGDESEPLMHSILHPLPNLRELYFLEDSPDPSLILDQSASGPLPRHLTLLGLSELVDFPAKLFYHLSSLRHLKIDSCTFDMEHTSTSVTRASLRPQLHSLYISGHDESQIEILAWMASPTSAFDLTALTSFRAEDQTNEDESYQRVRGIVRLCSSTLQDLRLDPPTAFAVVDAKITSETLPYPSTLSNLRIFTVSIIEDIGDYTNYVPWLNVILSSLPINNRLEEIHIQCTFPDLPEDDVLADHMLSLFGWNSFDDTMNSGHLNLKRVVVGVQDNSGQERVQDVRDLLQKGNFFPELEKKGILEIVNVDSTEFARCFSQDDLWYNA